MISNLFYFQKSIKHSMQKSRKGTKQEKIWDTGTLQVVSQISSGAPQDFSFFLYSNGNYEVFLDLKFRRICASSQM